MAAIELHHRNQLVHLHTISSDAHFKKYAMSAFSWLDGEVTIGCRAIARTSRLEKAC